jgi:hypothetical protein
MSENRKNLLTSVNDTTRTGKYEAMLDDEDRAELTQFVAWFKTQTESSASVSSYKSYLAKAWAEEQTADQLTSDQRSAVRKYGEFLAAREALLSDADEIDALGDEPSDDDLVNEGAAQIIDDEDAEIQALIDNES